MRKQILGLALSAFLLHGCITYYKPDPFAGLNLARHPKGKTVDVSLNRYWAESYFDGEGSTPHTSTTRRPEQKYIREDVTLSTALGLSRHLDLVLVCPVSHVFQRAGHSEPGEPGAWGIEHFWIGTSFMNTADRHVSLLVAVGIPIDGSIGDLADPDASHNGSARIAFQPIVTNGLPWSALGYYFRAGAVFHTDPEREDVDQIFDLPGELIVTLPLGRKVIAGPRIDAKFTMTSSGSSYDNDSRDAVAIGPYIAADAGSGLYVHGYYRSEIFGYYASAGTSWNLGLSYDFNFPGH